MLPQYSGGQHPGGRPPEVGQRPPACRSSALACSTGTGTSPSRCRPTLAGKAPGRRPWRATSRCCEPRRQAGEGGGDAGRGQTPAHRPGGWPQVGPVPLLMLDSYVEENEPRAARGRPAVRRRERAPAPASCCSASAASARCRAFRRITGHPEAGVFHLAGSRIPRLERIREYVAAGHQPTRRSNSRRARVHHPHPGRRGADQFPRELIERYFASEVDGALPATRVLAFGAETCGRRPTRVQHGRDGRCGSRGGSAASVLHGEVSQEMFAGPVARFDTAEVADRLDHQRRPRPGSPARSATWAIQPATRRPTPASQDPPPAPGPAGRRDQAQESCRVLAAAGARPAPS